MPQVATQGSIITINTGPCQTTTTVQTGISVPPVNQTVLIGGVPVATVNSPVTPWLAGTPPGCVTATGTVTSGAPKVLVGGNPLAFVGSTTAAGPITGGGVPTVTVAS